MKVDVKKHTVPLKLKVKAGILTLAGALVVELLLDILKAILGL